MTSNGTVDVCIVGKISLRNFEDDYDFNPYWSEESVTKTTIEFENDQDRERGFVVVDNDYSDENGDSISQTELNLRISRG